MNCLNPIYEYFSDILYNIKNIKDNDKKFLKFPKVHRLWKIFYDDNLKKNVDKDAQISSICFNGGYLKLVPLYEELKDKFETHKKDKNFNLTFEMYSIKGNINEFSNLISVELKEKKDLIEINFNKYIQEHHTNNINVKELIIIINRKQIEIYFGYEIYIQENINIEFKDIKEIYLLKNF